MKKQKIVEGIEIIRLDNASSNTKGPVFEWKNFTNEKIVQITCYQRKKGVIFGNHFHKGIDSSKNPEMFLMVSGEADFSVYNKFSNEKKTIRIKEGDVIIIYPNVLHKFTAFTDVVYIEPRTTIFDKNDSDCFTPEEYENYTI
ncbi:MAG: hypothetical protein HYS32_01405 [Candidatus Woesearchaeota archaeon]|nr:MAG: hypothetical protein HYS32_01405 [Candidatus Woesearchaeota archaeon]